MSRLAPFTDAATAIDRTNWGNFFISYYTWGEVLGAGARPAAAHPRAADASAAPPPSDDYMRLLWQRFGRAGATTPGVVDRPYTGGRTPAPPWPDVTGDEAFADEFFDRYVDGHEVLDFAPLFERAGLVLRPRAPERGWLGRPALRFERGGARVTAPLRFGTPLYDAGVARDDLLVSIDGRSCRRRPGSTGCFAISAPRRQVTVRYERRGAPVTATVEIVPDPARELLSLEQLGRRPTEAQNRFRAAWLGAKAGA